MDLGKKVKLIITGNHKQFVSYCRANSINPLDNYIRYIHSKDQLIGLHKDQVEVIYYGEYWKNKLIGNYELEKIKLIKLFN